MSCTHTLATFFMLSALALTGCGLSDDTPPGTPGEGGGELTEDEGKLIYDKILRAANENVSGSGEVSAMVGCAPSGSLQLAGTSAGSSVDQTYTVQVSASSCESVTIGADGERTELILSGGPVQVVKDASGGIVVTGELKWSAKGGRGGSCTMTPATSECK